MRDEMRDKPKKRGRKKKGQLDSGFTMLSREQGEVEVEALTAPISNPEPSLLDDFFEMPAPANEPDPVPIPAQEESYLALVRSICEENGFPFVSGRLAGLNNIQPDLVGIDRMVVLEVYDPRRTLLELTARVKALHHYGYRIQLITADDLMRDDARERCTRIIRSLLK